MYTTLLVWKDYSEVFYHDIIKHILLMYFLVGVINLIKKGGSTTFKKNNVKKYTFDDYY